METLTVQHNYIIVRPLKAPEQVRPSGLVLPQGDGVVHPVTGQRRINNRAVVIAVGPGPLTDLPLSDRDRDGVASSEALARSDGSWLRKPMSCKPGDVVLVRGSWIEVVINGEVLALGEDYQIAAIITEDGKPVEPTPAEPEAQILADGAPAN